MSAAPKACPRCGSPLDEGARYCPQCGEPVDPGLVAELQRLYGTLRDLDTRIAAGRGGQTVAELRADYLTRYTALRTAPASAAGPVSAPAVPAAPAPSTIPHVAVAAAPQPLPVRPPRPRRPAFSWQAFLAEQAIAIMAYLGGFLLLVAALTFELGGWQVLADPIKLAIVCIVYIIFGGLGFTLRRSTRLATVGRAYLGVFALMTPLVALAVYRFQLQAAGFPASGMLCLSALYAALVYLALALRTRFPTYAYLGWAALLVAALAVIPWSDARPEWWLLALGGVALALLAPSRVAWMGIARELGRPAIHISILASAVTLLGVEVFGAVGWTERLAQADPAQSISAAALAAAAGVLVPLAAGWSLTLRRWTPPAHPALVQVIEALGAALAAQAIAAAALWAGITSQGLAYVLAVLALAELAGALALLATQPERRVLRYIVEGLALALATLATALVFPDPSPNWPLVAALTAGLLVSLGMAVAERAQWWLLASGLFLLVDYQVAGTALLPPTNLAHDSSALYAALTMGVWVVALALGLRALTRRYAAPLYVVALAYAIYTTLLLTQRSDTVYQTAILLLFAATALATARRERQPVLGGIPAGVFGVLAALPFALTDRNGWHAIVLALGLALAALTIRRVLGSPWAVPPYASALAAAILAVWHAGTPDVSTASLAPLTVPLAVWLLVVFSALASVAALWEDLPVAMAIPAALALWAVVVLGDNPANLGSVFVIAGAGAAARQWRGRFWSVAWHVAAVAGSVIVVLALGPMGTPDAAWQAPLLLGYAVAAYLIAAQERQPWITPASTLYALAALWLWPGATTFVPTLVLTFALAAAGAALRRWAGREWSLAAYVAAVGASIFAVFRLTPFDAGHVEALLLVFAALAYALAALDGDFRTSAAAIPYAAAAVLVQPDAHALLPLALGLAVAGLIAGRVVGIRWSYPFYASATVAAAATAVLGMSNSGFEALALLALALLAYVIAAVESRPDVLPLALALGVLALSAGSGALRLAAWQSTLAFAALGWLYALGRPLWQRLPGLRERHYSWWAQGITHPDRKARWTDPRYVGAQVHRWSAILVSGGAVVSGLIAPDAFTPHAAQTQIVAVTLLAFGGMLALLGSDTTFRLALYGAGELVALAITWEARWLGADNLQAFVLAPGSYQLLIGALLPADDHLDNPERLAQAASLVGTLILLLSTLAQSLASEPNWVYALALAVEALVIVGVGVGTHSRMLVVAGSAFVGLAAIRGAILAIQSGLPIPLVIGVLAVLLMGVATWLSLRARRGPSHEA